MDKEKLKDLIITSSVTLLLGGLVALGTFGCHQLSKVSAEEEQPLLTQPLKASYDDNSYTITLTADEVNSYSWENFYTSEIDASLDNDSITLSYNSTTYNPQSNHSIDGYYAWESTITQGDEIRFIYNYQLYNSTQETEYDTNYIFVLVNTQTGVHSTFDYDLILTTNSTWYTGIKQAIEFDVQSNTLQYDFYLSSYQLNNNTYTYLANQINDNATSDDFTNTYIIYNDLKFDFEDYSVNDTLQFSYVNDNDVYSINFYLDSEGTDFSKFLLLINDIVTPFTNSVYFYNAEFLQDNLNAPVNWLSFLNSFISLLTGGLVTTASALGSGISAYVGSILVSGTSMSAFASVIFIFGGIALAFTLGRWVLNFITSLGNRNR